MIKRILLTCLFSFMAFVVLYSQSAGEYKTVTKNGFTLSWKTSGEYLDVKVSAECSGWIAVGFDPSNMMKDANFILSYVKDGKVFTSDEYGVSPISHKPDVSLGGTDNIKNVSGSEKGNVTEISFSIPLDSGDKYDVKLGKGIHRIILASSSRDDFTSKHNSRAKVEIEIN